MGDRPKSERQVRELARLRDEEDEIDHGLVAEAWGRVVERAEREGVPVTARLVLSDSPVSLAYCYCGVAA